MKSSLQRVIKDQVRHFFGSRPQIKLFFKKLLQRQYMNQQISQIEQKMIYSYIAQLEVRVQTLEAKLEIPNRQILQFAGARPSLKQIVSQAATAEQFLESDYVRLCHALGYEPIFHRKRWEYIFILRALKLHQKIGTGFRGLGFGVKQDPISAYLAKNGCQILATDMGQEEAYAKGWAQTNQYSVQISELNKLGICSPSVFEKNVQFRVMDMNFISDDVMRGEYDFVWSSCAFEHLGSLEKGIEFVLNTIRCLKPGGVAVHTTEFNASSNDATLKEGHTVIYRKQDIELLAQRAREMGCEVELNFNLGDQALDQHYDVPPYSEWNHIKLELDRYITTSYGLILRKSESSR